MTSLSLCFTVNKFVICILITFYINIAIEVIVRFNFIFEITHIHTYTQYLNITVTVSLLIQCYQFENVVFLINYPTNVTLNHFILIVILFILRDCYIPKCVNISKQS